MNYGIHNCILLGQTWQENTDNVHALLVQTDQLKCENKTYPAHFHSRIIFDRRLSLNSMTNYDSFAKSGLEIFLTRTSNKNQEIYYSAHNLVVK
jgi:hypothetical protein